MVYTPKLHDAMCADSRNLAQHRNRGKHFMPASMLSVSGAIPEHATHGCMVSKNAAQYTTLDV